MIMRVPLGKKQTNLEDKKEKSSAFFKHMIDLHMNMDRLRRNITTNLIGSYLRQGTLESEKRLIGWGEKAVPKLYILSREWKDVELTLRIVRVLKKINKPLANTAVSVISPEIDYNLYFISRKKDENVTNVYILSPDNSETK